VQTLVLAAIAFIAAVVGAVTGGGVTAILLPFLVFYVGIQEGVPIVTILLIVASISRITVYRRSIDVPAMSWFALGSVPATVLGTLWFTVAAPSVVTRLFGAVLIAAVVWRRLSPHPPENFTRLWFVPLGAAYGLLAGTSAALASLPGPFFLAYGLRKEAYVGTIGVSVFLGQVVKLAIFGPAGFLTTSVLQTSAILAPFVVGGTVLGKRILSRASEGAFVIAMDVFMVVAGLMFLIRG
jgi:uncharacterized membrane protein YfcA